MNKDEEDKLIKDIFNKHKHAFTELAKYNYIKPNDMNNKFSAHINLIQKGKEVKFFSLSFRNRLAIGDIITIDEIVLGEQAYLKNECGYGDDAVYKLRERTLGELNKIGVNLKQITEVKRVYMHPIVNHSCVDFSADVVIQTS